MTRHAPLAVGRATGGCTSHDGFLEMHPASEAVGYGDEGVSVPVPVFLLLLRMAPETVCFSTSAM